jgi:hypothetical protein
MSEERSKVYICYCWHDYSMECDWNHEAAVQEYIQFINGPDFITLFIVEIILFCAVDYVMTVIPLTY